MKHRDLTKNSVEILAGNGLPSWNIHVINYFSAIIFLGNIMFIKEEIFISNAVVLTSILFSLISIILYFSGRELKKIVNKRDKNLLDNSFISKLVFSIFICYLYGNLLIQVYQVII